MDLAFAKIKSPLDHDGITDFARTADMIRPSSKHRDEYERRLHTVLSYIDNHLDELIDLARLARVASFSTYHFHRIFATHTGETLGNYLTRRRVEQAAARLAAQPRLSVLEVALAVGFGSPEAFTRAFRKHFGVAPSRWRSTPQPRWDDKSKLGQAKSKAGQASAEGKVYAASMDKKTALQVTVKTRPAVRLAYLRYQGPFGAPLGRFWGEQVFPWLAADNLLGLPRYGVSHDDPQMTAEDKCRYDGGVEVKADYVPSRRVHIETLAGGLYACAAFRGSPMEFPRAWDWILREWLPQSGYQLAARPCFEFYPTDADCDEKSGTIACELCSPITEL